MEVGFLTGEHYLSFLGGLGTNLEWFVTELHCSGLKSDMGT